jgi:hypothetical protein
MSFKERRNSFQSVGKAPTEADLPFLPSRKDRVVYAVRTDNKTSEATQGKDVSLPLISMGQCQIHPISQKKLDRVVPGQVVSEFTIHTSLTFRSRKLSKATKHQSLPSLGSCSVSTPSITTIQPKNADRLIRKLMKREIFLLIRSFLVPATVVTNSLNIFHTNVNGSIEDFEQYESRKSWRLFLYTCNDEIWRRMRKSTILLTLYRPVTIQYLTDSKFRTKLLSKVDEPASQLSLTFQNSVLKGFPEKDQALLNNLRELNLSCCQQLISLPVLKNIYSLNVSRCSNLRFIQDLENVKNLNLSYCPKLETVGSPAALQPVQSINLLQCSFSFQMAVFSSFSSLSLLEELTLNITSKQSTSNEQFPFNFNICSNLRSLSLLPSSQNVSQPSVTIGPLTLPKLETLECWYIILEDISGLTALKNLAVYFTEIIKGRREIFSQLRQLSGNRAIFLQDDLTQYPHLQSFHYDCPSVQSLPPLEQYQDIAELILRCPVAGGESELIPSFVLGNKMKSLTLGNILQDKLEFFSPYLPRVNLIGSKIRDVSFLRQLTHLSLEDCLEVTDVSPLKDVLYLNLRNCRNIRIFNLLGKQKYLNVSGCRLLENKHLVSWNRIACLDVSSCFLVNDLTCLKDTLFLTANDCTGLKNVKLTGNNYLKVSLQNCRNLTELEVYGKIFCLSMGGSRFKIDEESSKRIYSKIE